MKSQTKRLYGRALEISSILDSYHQTRNGLTEHVLISGESGSGKTSIVINIISELKPTEYYLLHCKSDQYAQSKAYSALSTLIDPLIQYLFSLPQQKMDDVLNQLEELVGENLLVLSSFHNEISKLTNTPNELPNLPIKESEQRFSRTLSAFLDVALSLHEFVILHIDDIHWIDQSSLEFLRSYINNNRSQNIFVVGTIRDNEAPNYIIETIKGLTTKVNTVLLGDLNKAEVTEWLDSTFEFLPKKNTALLAGKLIELTKGNPLFLERAIDELSTSTRIGSDIAHDLNDLLSQIVSSDKTIQGLISSQFTRLSPQAQYILSAAACLKHETTTSILAMFSANPSNVQFCIDEACSKGMIVKTKKGRENEDNIHNQSYRFVHDKVQQAAKHFLNNEEQLLVHYKFGQSLLDFDFSRHLDNTTLAKLDSLNSIRTSTLLRSQQLKLSQLNIKAANAANEISSYAEAHHYAGNAIRASKLGWWKSHYNHMANLYYLYGTLELGFGNSNNASKIAIAALTKVRSRREKTEFHELKMMCETASGDYDTAIETAKVALKLWDIDLPNEETYQSTIQEMEIARLKCTPDLLENIHNITPTLPIGDLRSIMSLMVNLLAPTDAINPPLNNWLGLKMLNFTLNNGYVPESAKAIANYGCSVGAVGDTSLGYELGRRAMALTLKDPNSILQSRVGFSFLTYLKHWKIPIKTISNECEALRIQCIKDGDILYAGFLYGMSGSLIRIFDGSHLSNSKKYLESANSFCAENENTSSELLCISALMGINNLQGRINNKSDFNYNDLDETFHIRSCESSGNMMAITLLRVIQALIFLISNDIKNAHAAIESAAKNISSLYATYPTSVFTFIRTIVLIRYESTNSNKKAQLKSTIDLGMESLDRWTNECPINYLGFISFVRGEKAIAYGDNHTALKEFQLALTMAHKSGNTWLLALTHERIADIWSLLNGDFYFQFHILNAIDSYQRWGATRKVNELRELHNFVYENKTDNFTNRGDSLSTPDNAEINLIEISNSLDYIATQENSVEITRKLLSSVLTVLSANYACLLENHNNSLTIFATTTPNSYDQHKIDVEMAEGIELCPISIIRAVNRKRETLKSSFRNLSLPYSNDPLFEIRKPDSIYCFPVYLHGKFEGIVYLESSNGNRIASDENLMIAQTILHQVFSYTKISRLINNTDLEVKQRTEELIKKVHDFESVYKNLVQKARSLSRLRQFTPPAVAKLVLNSNYELQQPHRRKIAILFVDLRGFTEYSESLESEEAKEFLNSYHNSLGRIISLHGGITDHIAGDGLMVFLGDPEEQVDVADIAVRMAISMRDSVNALLHEQFKRDRNLGFGIGISFGYATIGLTGFKGGRSYSATGRYVNIASRLCDAALHSEILISLPVLAELKHTKIQGEHSSIQLKGFQKKTNIFKVKSITQ